MPGYQPRHDTDPVWFNGTQVNNLSIASQQTGVRITAIHGWDDRPDVRDVRDLRSGQDGEYADNLYLGGRTITIEGEVYGSTWANLQSRKRTLAALFAPSSDEVLFKVPDPATASPTTSYSTTGMTGYERVSCRVIEAIQFGDTLDPCCQTFQVMLRASDPRVYSDVETSTDSGTTGTLSRTVAVDQGGTYPTPPVISVYGPTSAAWSVFERTSGLNLSMSQTVASGEVVEFDVANRTVTTLTSFSKARTDDPNLIAIWMLNETSGTTADNAEGTAAYDGTYTGGYTLNQSGPASGLASVDLNGSTGYVSIPFNAALFPTNGFTLEGWVNFDSTTGARTIIDGVTSSKGWGVDFDTVAGRAGLRLNIYTTAGYSYAFFPAPRLAESGWHHIQVPVPLLPSGSSYRYGRVMVDGELQTSTYWSSGGAYVPATSGGYRLGSKMDGSQDLDGKLAAIALYGTEHSEQRMAEIYEVAQESSVRVNAYGSLDATTTVWAPLGTGAATVTLGYGGLSTGTMLNVSYRDARL